MLRRRISSLLSLAIALLAAVAVGAQSVSAVDSTSADANASRGLQISPALVELNAEAGKSYTLKVKAFNVTNSDQGYTSVIQDFRPKNESGEPALSVDESLPASASIRSWIRPISAFSLEGSQSRELEVIVNVPQDAEPGGHYGAIAFSSGVTQLGPNEQVGVSVKTGLLMLIRVAGDIKEELSVESFTTTRGDKPTRFFETGPITFVSRFNNTGNIHVKPVGAIEVVDSFGNKVADVPVNKAVSNVLPNSIRRFEGELSKDWMIGRYTASLVVGYGEKGQALTAQTSFWVIPYKFIAVGLLVLVTLLYIARRLIRAYNQRIIKQAQDAQKAATKAKKKAGKK